MAALWHEAASVSVIKPMREFQLWVSDKREGKNYIKCKKKEHNRLDHSFRSNRPRSRSNRPKTITFKWCVTLVSTQPPHTVGSLTLIVISHILIVSPFLGHSTKSCCTLIKAEKGDISIDSQN